MDLGLKGKVAMVAGASRGLGFAIAKELAGEGALVSIASRNSSAVSKRNARCGSKRSNPYSCSTMRGSMKWSSFCP